jgi:hypothetical protein
MEEEGDEKETKFSSKMVCKGTTCENNDCALASWKLIPRTYLLLCLCIITAVASGANVLIKK